ncbi:MAG: tetratricopeptide repeat protein [Bacteroidota bacterium]
MKRSKYYLRRNLDSSRFYLKQIKKEADRLDSDSLLAAYHLNTGSAYYYRGNYDSAIHFWKCVLNYSGGNDSTFHSFASNNIGLVYTFQSQNDSAILYMQRAAELKEQLSDPSIGNTYNNLGEINLKLGFIAKAKTYFFLGLQRKIENGFLESLGNSYLNIGRAYKRLYQLDSAVYYSRRAYRSFEEINDKKGIADALNNLGNYFRMENTDSAIYFLNRSAELKKELGNTGGLLFTYLSLSDVFIQSKNWKEARSLLDNARPLAEEMKSPLSMKSILSREIQIDSVNGNWRSAFNKMNQVKVLQDSIYDLNMANTTKELEAKFESKQKAQKIALLQQQNQTRLIELQKRTQFQYFLGLTLLLVVGIGIVSFRYVRQKSSLKEQNLLHEISQLRAEIQSMILMEKQAFDRPLEEINQELSDPLSDREYDVLQKICSNKTNREIAEELYVSVNTIKTHLKNMYHKLGVNTRQQALQRVLPES